MKIRSRIRRNMQPGLSRLGWRNNVRVVRITTSEVDLCKRLGIPVEKFARMLYLYDAIEAKLKEKNGG